MRVGRDVRVVVVRERRPNILFVGSKEVFFWLWY